MNERIRELAEEAGIYVPMFDENNEDNAKLEKFAELIIKRCATVADFAHLGGVIEPGAMVKEYFGVE